MSLPVLIAAQATIPAVFLVVRGLHVAAKVAAVDFHRLADAAQVQAADFGRHGFTQLMGQDERRLVLAIQIAAQGQGRLALTLIAENHDGREILAERHLVESE